MFRAFSKHLTLSHILLYSMDLLRRGRYKQRFARSRLRLNLRYIPNSIRCWTMPWQKMVKIKWFNHLKYSKVVYGQGHLISENRIFRILTLNTWLASRLMLCLIWCKVPRIMPEKLEVARLVLESIVCHLVQLLTAVCAHNQSQIDAKLYLMGNGTFEEHNKMIAALRGESVSQDVWSIELTVLKTKICTENWKRYSFTNQKGLEQRGHQATNAELTNKRSDRLEWDPE